MGRQSKKESDMERDNLKFESISQTDVPKARDGKHKRIVTRLLEDIDELKAGTALKVPLSALPDTKENIRSALNRATRLRGISVETSSDADHLYIWKTPQQK
ncbi:MAG TPA: hypothetical protein VL498_00850 [Terracidiphilus sp.]|jgi:hypothetical protein|nr:hypothetical protein [Terracidiphilus sp.]